MKREKNRLERIKKENEKMQVQLIIAYGMFFIAMIVCLFNLGGNDQAIKCKKLNNNSWCNQYQLNKMGD